MHDSVTIHMKASPQQVWDLVSDVTRIGRYSPETFEAEWVDGATGPATGAKFRGHVNRNGRNIMRYWTTCTVRECEPGQDLRLRRGQLGQAVEHMALRHRGGG